MNISDLSTLKEQIEQLTSQAREIAEQLDTDLGDCQAASDKEFHIDQAHQDAKSLVKQLSVAHDTCTTIQAAYNSAKNA